MCSKSFKANSREKTCAKSEYFVGIEMGVLFATNTAICALQER